MEIFKIALSLLLVIAAYGLVGSMDYEEAVRLEQAFLPSADRQRVKCERVDLNEERLTALGAAEPAQTREPKARPCVPPSL